jgi:hypothetical protein
VRTGPGNLTGAERLAQDGGVPGRGFDRGRVGIAGDEDQLLAGPQPPGGLGNVGAVHAGHGEVEHQEVERSLRQQRQAS